MTYREHPAPPALAPWLACTWERRDGGGPPVRVVPDGCIDIVWTQGAGAQVVGPNTTAFLVQAHFAHDCRALAGVPPTALL